jgi:uncharacterized membrane protein YfcA
MIDWQMILLLCAFAFLAGFVDAIVGGGGLIQTPAALILLPNLPVATVIGSLKIPSFSGTAFAVVQYLKKVQVYWMQIAVMCAVAFGAAYSGSMLLSMVSNQYMKPIIFIVLCGVAIYTYTRKQFGQTKTKTLTPTQNWIRSIIISLIIGFYDGFIGPGAGSFLVLAFIAVLGHDFLHASAHAKLVNLATNLGSILLFVLKGSIIWSIAIPMAVSNALGGILGARTAIAKGNQFIRIFFLLVVFGTLIRFGYDIFFK